MLIAEDLLLLLTDDVTGKPTVDSQRLTYALAGAVLVELVLAGRLAVTDAGQWGSGPRVAVVDRNPVGDPLLDEALERAAARRQPVAAQSLLTVLGKGLLDGLRTRLVAQGVLRVAEGRTLGIFPTRVWPTADSRHETQLRTALWDVVVRGRDPQPREACVVSLLHALDQVHRQSRADGVSSHQLRARAKAVAQGNVGGDAVRRAVQAADAAVVAVMAGAAVFGATS